MRIITTIVSLLAATVCHGAELFGVPLFDAEPTEIESYPADWRAPLLPPELLPPRSTNPAPAVTASNPLATILGVSRDTDKRALTVQYELSGHTNQLQVILPNWIEEFHFCSWVKGRGIALALSDEDGEVYWAAFYFAGRTGPIYPRRLRCPPGHSLLGIVNNRGDSIIISAVARESERGHASGWMYFNGCPPASDIFSRIPTNQVQIGGFEHLVQFETMPTSRRAE